MAVALVDNFTRANEGPPPTGWVTSSGTGVKILSNRCVSNNTAVYQAASWNTLYGPDMEVAVTYGQVAADGVYEEAVVRLQTANVYNSDHYEFDTRTVASAEDQFEFWKCVSTVFTQLGATVFLGANYTAGDTWGGRVTGNILEGFLNGASLGTRTDSDVALAGYAGLSITGGTPASEYTAFYAGSILRRPCVTRRPRPFAPGIAR